MSTSWLAVADAASHAAKAVGAPGPVRLQSLSPEAAAEIEAMIVRILPSDDGPGAREVLEPPALSH